MLRDKDSGRYYTQKDLDKAYNMGLEAAVVVIEKMPGLSPSEQRKMVKDLKERMIESKVRVTMVS